MTETMRAIKYMNNNELAERSGLLNEINAAIGMSAQIAVVDYLRTSGGGCTIVRTALVVEVG